MSVPPTVPIPAAMPGAALLAAAADSERTLRDRLAAVGADLSRHRAYVLDDETRARTTLLIEAVIGAVDAALRAAEPRLDAAPGTDLAERFVRSGLLAGSGLAAAALLRAEEHRLAGALIRGAGAEEGAGAPGLDPIAGDFAAESVAVRSAEAARLDRTGEPLLPLHDLAAEDAHALVWQVAACLAEEALALQGAARAGNEDAMHRAAAAAVARTLAGIDEGDGIAAATIRLAHAMLDGTQLDDALLAGTLAAGRIALLAAMLAVRVGIAFADARAMLTDPARCALLLRACDVDPRLAAAMVLALAFGLARGPGDDPGDHAAAIIAEYEALSVDRARAEVRRARLDPHYRAALALLAGEVR